MAAAKKQTKKDLETKIAELEAKLTKLATQLEAKPTPKPAETKPAEVKPAETKPAETAKPKPTLPKGSEVKPAETAKPKETPKPAETTTQPPATLQAALEDAYYNSQMSDFHQYRAKVTGYSPAPNRYHVRRTAPVGRVPTTNWNDQKLKVTGYTSASNQYFATRARMAYHPADKTFGSFSGVNMTFDGIVEQTQQQAPPQEAPKPKGTLPKGTEQTSSQQSSSTGNEKSRKENLESYEKDYLDRIEQDRIADEKAYREIIEAEAKSQDKPSHGSLPKGFEAPSEPEAPKPSKGTLPKGF